ncbi:fimbrillin family protein [Segatella paludivivens]|uniref:fimbrillin family protein n=1 Tax=Segatella paludivivens TaxID=185294 RepID=UPI0003A4537F|nr:fimbrillin family protein [Segatella paludivivens]
MIRTFLRGINVSFLLLIIFSTFCSCANEINIFGENNNEQINFSVSVPKWENTDSLATTKTSRAMPVGGTSLSTSNSFNLIADQNDGTGNYSTLIDKKSVSFTNNIWQTSPSHYYWSGTANKTISFYAYYPSTISNVIHAAGSSPTLSYTVSDNVSDQLDIMTATNNNVSGNTNSSTLLTFNHIFAAIQFSVGSAGIGSGTISSISIGNVANSGTYTFGSGWSNVTGSKTFTISQSKTITGTSGEDIYSGSYTLMMIPQAINNVTITITYSNGGTLTKVISGSWKAGNTYNYKISYIREYNYTGNVQSFSAPISGTYKIECWGAQGGTLGSLDTEIGGTGGYTTGEIKLSKGTALYVYVGQQGQATLGGTISGGGWNGGGNGDATGYTGNGRTGGGGSTDIRVLTGAWNDSKSLNSRIMVAGAGGGGGGNGLAGGAGGLSGYNGSISTAGRGGTQSAGGSGGSGSWGNATAGGLGYGGTGCSYASGGGSGYYGGGGGARDLYDGNGGGGSSYISGQSGCSIYSSTYIFSKTSISDSKTTILSPTGLLETGHSGNGYARITFVSAN